MLGSSYFVFNGKVKVNRAPCGMQFSAQIFPLWLSIICLLIANPNPLPIGFNKV